MSDDTTPTTTTGAPTGPGVIHAVSAVMRELPAIGKDERAPANMGGYAYRGIETMVRVIQPLLAKHGIVIVPTATLNTVDHAPGSKEAWQDTYLTVEWQVYGPDGSWFKAQTVGVGRDHTDKGAAKAATAAFKYLLLHLFCVADGADESEGHDYAAAAVEPPGLLVFYRLRDHGQRDPGIAQAMREFAASKGRTLQAQELTDDEQWAAAVEHALDEQIAVRALAPSTAAGFDVLAKERQHQANTTTEGEQA